MLNATAAAAHAQVPGYTYGIRDVDDGPVTRQEVCMQLPKRPETEIRVSVETLAKSPGLLALLRPERRAAFLAYAGCVNGRIAA